MIPITTGTLGDVFAVCLRPLTNPASGALPKHLGLLFDTSGSMAGERLANLKKTSELLIGAKPDHYALSLVAFHTHSDVLVEHETDKGRLAAAVEALRADGGTNLQEGILALRTVNARHPMDAVLLLTDGDVTHGVSSVKGIVSLLESALPQKPPVHTIGIGERCNRTLLASIATLTRSLYMYADAAETLPAVVGDVLAGVQAEVARAATLHFPPENVVCMEPGEREPGLYSIGTLIGEKEQWVLLRLSDKTFPTITLRYTTADGHPCEQVVGDVGGEGGRTVACQMARIECAKGFADIQELMIVHRREEAFEKANALLAFLNASIAVDETMVVVLKAQVSEVLEQLDPALRAAAAPPPPGAPDLLSRLASNTSALSNQRGFCSRMASGGDDTFTFSSPQQQAVQRSLTTSYSAAPVAAATVNTLENAPPPPPPPAFLRRC